MKTAGGFRVVAERCDQCLFGPNAIVSARRRKEVLNRCMKRAKETFFVCHKTSDVCCRGFYDSDLGGRVAVIQIARRLGFVEFVEVAP